MPKQLVPVEMDGVTLWVEAVVTPGSQDTSSINKATERISDAFDSLQTVLSSISRRIVAAAQDLREEVTSPSEISAEFGLKLATTGQVILISGTAEASFSITLTFKLEGSPGR